MSSILIYCLVAAVSVGAGFLTATVGFGGAIFTMLILPLVLPFLSCVGLSTTISFAGTVALAWQFRRHARWRELWLPMGVYLLLAVPAIFIVSSLDILRLKIAVSVFLVLLVVYNLSCVRRGGDLRIPKTKLATVICAVTSGLAAGFFGIGGPPMALYFLAITENDKNAYIGTLQWFFTISMVFTVGARFVTGIMTLDLLPLALCGMAASLAGKELGVRVVSRLNIRTLKILVCVFIMVAGLATIFNCFRV